ncbi:hypothetical protein [Mesorhizobium atlanticum]|uniref:hypothetical protein n=1 Tax=Mesorhizobium atlanticum TaxID=2233532 RepID=UPI0015EBC1C6|nr:hypothetical protein [Mesorhizobium atlanticum]
MAHAAATTEESFSRFDKRGFSYVFFMLSPSRFKVARGQLTTVLKRMHPHSGDADQAAMICA